MAPRNKPSLAEKLSGPLPAPLAPKDTWIPLSIRPGDKISSMLEILAALTSRSPAEYASEGVSESLFLYLTATPDRLALAAAQIAETLQRGETLQEGCALDLLVRRGVIEIRG